LCGAPKKIFDKKYIYGILTHKFVNSKDDILYEAMDSCHDQVYEFLYGGV